MYVTTLHKYKMKIKKKNKTLKNHFTPQVSWVSQAQTEGFHERINFFSFEKVVFLLPLDSTGCTTPVKDVVQP